MQLTLNGISDRTAWEKAGIILPSYDVEAAKAKAIEAPRWVHFGIGNIFRIFIGGIADGMLENGSLDRGLTCVETFDFDVVDKIYKPYDNLGLSVILRSDGTREYRVLGSMAEAIAAKNDDPAQWARLKEIFKSRDLQIVSFTITEKGYALKNAEGSFFPFVQADIDAGPEKAGCAMAILTAMLYERYIDSKTPVALVSMDNCSQNGFLLKNSIRTMAEEWEKKGYVSADFVAWVTDEANVSCPCTMIDKITPRPSPDIANDLEELGVENMQPVVTSKRTYIAPFINAEGPQYLVIEDRFPNGRPALEKGNGVYMGDYDTVNKSERMKVTCCLNPTHTATGPIGVVLGIDLFADMLERYPVMMKMGRTLVYKEGMDVVPDPKILSPKAFADELFEDRFPNKYLGDTNLRLATDSSQGVGVRFGETVKAYVKKYGTASMLTALPLGIAGWLRYLLGIDDAGNTYELAPDPLAPVIHDALSDVVIGQPDTLKDQLRPILSNENIFFTDLYAAGLGEKIEDMFREMIAGKGATLATVEKYMATV